MKAICLDPDDTTLIQTLLPLLQAQEWAALADALRRYTPETAYAAMRLLGEAAPLDADLSALIRRGGAEDLALAGALLHGRAFRFRGLGPADTVSEDQVELYLPTISHAQELLVEASFVEPSNGLVAAWRITASLDLSEEDKDEAEAALHRAERVPIAGLSRLVTMRSEKWGGSHEEMWRAVRSQCERDPPASLALIGKAHFEQYFWFAYFDEAPPEGYSYAHDYLRQPAVREELAEASARVLAGGGQADPRALVFADNCFAAAFAAARNGKAARPHLQRMGRAFDRTVWLHSSPRLAVNQARLRALLLPL